MRIAFPISAFPPEGTSGGLAAFYHELARALANLGHEVLVLTLTAQEPSEEVAEGVRIHRLHFDPSRYRNLQILPGLPVFSWSLPRAMELYRASTDVFRQFKPDIIEVVESGFEGLAFALDRSLPMVVRCLCPQTLLMQLDLDKRHADVDRALCTLCETLLISSADEVTTPSHNLAGIISSEAGIPLSDIAIIRNPLPCPVLEKDTRDDRSYFQAGSFPRILFAGRIEKLKGVDLLVEAMPFVLRRFPDAELILAGSEPKLIGSSNSFADILRQRAADLGISARVRFLGALSRADLDCLRDQCQLAVFPSRYDSSPYACLETMARAVPVIATRVGGIPEYVAHGDSGWLTEPESIESLKDAIVHLASDQALRQTLAERARAQISKLCSPVKIAEQTTVLYRRALNHPRREHLPNSMLVSRAMEAFDLASQSTVVLETLERTFHEGRESAWQTAYAQGYSDGRAASALKPLELLARAGRKLKEKINA